MSIIGKTAIGKTAALSAVTLLLAACGNTTTEQRRPGRLAGP